jgi:hypothetical protein
MREVQIIKLGTIMGKPISQTILIDNNRGPIVEYYTKLLMNNSEYKFQNSSGIVKHEFYTQKFRPLKTLDILKDVSIFGKCDGDPVIGQPYSINNYTWRTSIVNDIIEGVIIITNNSVYAIHSVGELRNAKLEKLGI